MLYTGRKPIRSDSKQVVEIPCTVEHAVDHNPVVGLLVEDDVALHGEGLQALAISMNELP